jgi:hypothetical protein
MEVKERWFSQFLRERQEKSRERRKEKDKNTYRPNPEDFIFLPSRVEGFATTEDLEFYLENDHRVPLDKFLNHTYQSRNNNIGRTMSDDGPKKIIKPSQDQYTPKTIEDVINMMGHKILTSDGWTHIKAVDTKHKIVFLSSTGPVYNYHEFGYIRE